MKYQSVIVKHGDTLESITISTTGSEDNINTIVQINNLRYPYISDDPRDQFAYLKGNLFLTGVVNSGANPVTFQNLQALQLRLYDTVFFYDEASNIYEGRTIQSMSYSGSQVTITFDSPLDNIYQLSTEVRVYDNQQNVRTQVLQTGQLIYVPAENDSFLVVINGPQSIYGTDIALDQNMTVLKQNGDLQTVTGYQNVNQACQIRAATPYGSYDADPTYGNRLFDIVGDVNTSYFTTLATAFLTQCFLSDTRVDNVKNLQLSTQNDAAIVQADIYPSNATGSFTLSAVLGGVFA